MDEKQKKTDTLSVSLDANELVGLSQVASVSPANTELSLSDLGRVLSKKGEVMAPVSDSE